MQLKTLKNPLEKHSDSKGLTIVELILTITLATLIVMAVIYIINPADSKSRARDQVRLSDLQTLERVINEYKIDNNIYPGPADVTLISTTIAPGGSGETSNANFGWIGANVSSYTSSLPLDPTNDATYNYTYRHSGSSYELNTTLESLTYNAQNDGGNSPTLYEVGNNLSVL